MASLKTVTNKSIELILRKEDEIFTNMHFQVIAVGRVITNLFERL